MAIKNTPVATKEQREAKWYLVDADNLVLGRAASIISKILRGKHKTCYTPNIDCGDYVVVINAEKIQLTGNKLKDKVYHKHTGYAVLGGVRRYADAENEAGWRLVIEHTASPVYGQVRAIR